MTTDPIFLDAIELWQLRAFEQGDETTGEMLREIRGCYVAGYVPEVEVRVAIQTARKRLDPPEGVSS